MQIHPAGQTGLPGGPIPARGLYVGHPCDKLSFLVPFQGTKCGKVPTGGSFLTHRVLLLFLGVPQQMVEHRDRETLEESAPPGRFCFSVPVGQRQEEEEIDALAATPLKC